MLVYQCVARCSWGSLGIFLADLTRSVHDASVTLGDAITGRYIEAAVRIQLLEKHQGIHFALAHSYYGCFFVLRQLFLPLYQGQPRPRAFSFWFYIRMHMPWYLSNHNNFILLTLPRHPRHHFDTFPVSVLCGWSSDHDTARISLCRCDRCRCNLVPVLRFGRFSREAVEYLSAITAVTHRSSNTP